MKSESAVIPRQLINEAQRVQNSLRHPNPHLTVNLPLLPVYLGEIFPLHPVNKVLPELNIIKVLNHA